LAKPICKHRSMNDATKGEREKQMKILYTAEATAHGGREGKVQSSDGNLVANLRVPSEMGGPGGEGTNPEQLFAAGYAACFQSALMLVARRQHADASQSSVTAKVGIGPTEGGAYGLDVELHVSIPNVDAATGEKLIEAAHKVCPYSNATRGNVPVKLVFEK